MATGGLGRAYKITSNSWEYTGDGYALAYDAGAALQDLEFIQFHPTGMVWPPSVKGILVTEGVRGEGGVLLNKDGRRFMFDDIPDNYRNQTAKDEEEGWRYTQGDKSANRPPELLTRDHVARCINREVKAGRGSPHGGVYLDIAWIKKKLPNAADHIKRKLPSMYHQFKQLANLDITEVPMEVGPDDPLHDGRHSRGRRHADVHAARSLRRGRSGGRSPRREPPRRQLAVGPDRVRQARGRLRRGVCQGERRGPTSTMETSRQAVATALAPFERGASGENPYAIQHDLQDMMQDLVGIVRQESEMLRGARAARRRCGSARPGPASSAIANTTTAGTRPSTSTIC